MIKIHTSEHSNKNIKIRTQKYTFERDTIIIFNVSLQLWGQTNNKIRSPDKMPCENKENSQSCHQLSLSRWSF